MYMPPPIFADRLALGVMRSRRMVAGADPGPDEIAETLGAVHAQLREDLAPLLEDGRPYLVVRMPDLVRLQEIPGGSHRHVCAATMLVALATCRLARPGEVASSPGEFDMRAHLTHVMLPVDVPRLGLARFRREYVAWPDATGQSGGYHLVRRVAGGTTWN